MPTDHEHNDTRPVAGAWSRETEPAVARSNAEHPPPHHLHPVLDTRSACRPTAPCQPCQQRVRGEAEGRPHEQGSAAGVLPVELVHTDNQPRTLREILFTHRALAAATALEITGLMVELAEFIRRGPSHQHCTEACEPFPDRPPVVAETEEHLRQQIRVHPAVWGPQTGTRAAVDALIESVVAIYRLGVEQADKLDACLRDARAAREQFQRDQWSGWSDEFSPDSKSAQRAGERWDALYPGLAALIRTADDNG